jgi:antitoxin PrlF
MYATITSKGQITLPKHLRESLDLEKGDRIEFVKEDDGRYAIVPVTGHLSSLKGFLPAPSKKVSLEDMDNAIRGRFKIDRD